MSNNTNVQKMRFERKKLGISGRIAAAFLESKLTPLLVVFALFIGAFAVMITPREEEPQIVVPMVDVFVQHPGGDAKEVERLVSTPMEKLLWEIPGVEYVYTTSRPGLSMAIVRFLVGEDEEDSLIKVYNKLYGNLDRIPIGVSQPLVKLRGIDDVPVMALTLHSSQYDHFMLRRVAEEVATELKKEDNVSEVRIIGGLSRQVQVQLDPDRLAGYSISPLQVVQALGRDNDNLPAGSFDKGDANFLVEVGDFFRNTDEVGQTVVAVYGGRPVYLSDVATIVDGPEEISNYVFHRNGAGAHTQGTTVQSSDWPFAEEAAVTIALAKRRGANATWLTQNLQERIQDLEGSVIVSGIDYEITRDYGFTAQEKSDELIFHMGLATIAVVILMGIFLGRKEAVVVAVAVPVTLALTLFTSYFFGYTLNRVTLFALIFAIGILVDDAIVVVENIHRHYRMNWGPRDVLVPFAVDEVGNPTILATFTVIFALMPLAFVSGLMGPYMSPIPINASAAMFFSLVVAFVVTPWLTNIMLKFSEKIRFKKGDSKKEEEEHKTSGSLVERIYLAIMKPLVEKPLYRNIFLFGVVVLLFASMSLVYVRAVKVKMLPHDNKSEFQVIIDMPEGSTLEKTAAVTRDIADYIASDPMVAHVQTYIGTAAPINFNGLVRHYFLRQGPTVADIQVNLLEKHARDEKSHAIARRMRPEIQKVASPYNAAITVAEVPPGPPVLSTLVAEIYGPEMEGQLELASQIKELFENTPGVVDVDWYVEDAQDEYRLVVDKTKAALAGVTTQQITNTLGLALYGKAAGLLHTQRDQEPVELMVRVPAKSRSSIDDLARIKVHGGDGRLVPISELVREETSSQDLSVYHKNLRRVVYVVGEAAGEAESPVYGILDMKKKIEKFTAPDGGAVNQIFNGMPESEKYYTVKWDGEWQVTYEVFRDMGIAFGVVMVLIYILVVAWFRSFLTPVIIMVPIPLTLVGILPGHFVMNTFFTATSMIGFIALAGIIVRNSILLVDFIEQEMEAGTPLKQAVLEAGAVRFRPIVLTAAALVIGGSVILLDPIFSGLAVSLIFGVTISTALTLLVIPLLYYVYRSFGKKPAKATQNKEDAS